jgi:hypothetical protein
MVEKDFRFQIGDCRFTGVHGYAKPLTINHQPLTFHALLFKNNRFIQCLLFSDSCFLVYRKTQKPRRQCNTNTAAALA